MLPWWLWWYWHDDAATYPTPTGFLRYLWHLVLLVLVSFAVFIPLFRFSQDYPEIFWMRQMVAYLVRQLSRRLMLPGN